MKYWLFVLGVVLAIMPLSAEGKSLHNGAHLTFEKSECDFGTVSREGENREYIFRFVNDGSEPLVILSATTTCSCLKSEFSRKPVAVGASGEIRIILESKKIDKGVFHRIVQIRSNSTDGTEILTIKGVAKD